MAASPDRLPMSAQEDPKNIYKVGLGSVRFLMSVGDLVIGWLLRRQAVVAMEAWMRRERCRPRLLRGARSPWYRSSPELLCRC